MTIPKVSYDLTILVQKCNQVTSFYPSILSFLKTWHDNSETSTCSFCSHVSGFVNMHASQKLLQHFNTSYRHSRAVSVTQLLSGKHPNNQLFDYYWQKQWTVLRDTMKWPSTLYVSGFHFLHSFICFKI